MLFGETFDLGQCDELKVNKCSVHRYNLSSSRPQDNSSGAYFFRPWDFGEYSLLVLLIVGTFGNSLCILVMTSRRMRASNASLFITCLAISDIVVLWTKFMSNMVKVYKVPVFNGCWLMLIVPQAATFISVWLIVVTSAERTVAVLKPLKALFFTLFKKQMILLRIFQTFYFVKNG